MVIILLLYMVNNISSNYGTFALCLFKVFIACVQMRTMCIGNRFHDVIV